jgi:hypothetical protein
MNEPRSRILSSLSVGGYACVPAAQAAAAFDLDLSRLDALRPSWDALPRDGYLRDGGGYRARRHSCFTQEAGAAVQAVVHRPHWQPTSYNALHGGLTRWFEPVTPPVLASAAWPQLLGAIGNLFAEVRALPCWFIEAHQFRIDTASGIGRPTPEGAHRDGVDFVAVILVGRHHVVGGETRVFDVQGSSGVRFTMTEPWSMLLLDDARVIHETTPIQPDGPGGRRDTLVLTYRARGFQAPDGAAASGSL